MTDKLLQKAKHSKELEFTVLVKYSVNIIIPFKRSFLLVNKTTVFYTWPKLCFNEFVDVSSDT